MVLMPEEEAAVVRPPGEEKGGEAADTGPAVRAEHAPVVEYRHDLWSSAELTDVSIPGFDAAPYLGDSSTNLNDAAFRPGCDGGLIVGGKSDWRGTRGLVIEFRIEGLRSCGGTL